MKCVSVRQPWAQLIVDGRKPVENRSWGTDYRGPLLIHASKTYDRDGQKWIESIYETAGRSAGHAILEFALPPYHRNGIVGAVELYGCLPPGELSGEHEIDIWRDIDQWGWLMRDQTMLPMGSEIAFSGKLGLFEVPDAEVGLVRAQMNLSRDSKLFDDGFLLGLKCGREEARKKRREKQSA